MDGLMKMRFHSIFGCITSIYFSNPVISYLWYYLQDCIISFNGAALQKILQWVALPKDIKAFWDIFTAGAGSKDSPVNEKLNALGNHLGSYNVRLDLHLRKFKAGLYWQSIFEDNSGRKLRNGEDGLWGLSIRYQHASISSFGRCI